MYDPTTQWVENSVHYDLSRHYSERSVNGFSTYDWWNFNEHLAFVLIGALERFKEEGHGMFTYEDSNPTTHDRDLARTNEEYQTMIDGFKAFLDFETMTDDYPDVKTMQEKLDAALEVFSKRFLALWD